jgi:hypothetical protein
VLDWGRMSRLRAMATLTALLCGACGIDGGKPVDRCAGSAGTLIECGGPGPLSGAEDACWRLVQCGSIPAATPDSDPGGFDWGACVEHVEYLPDDQFEAALACIEAARCDELRAPAHALPACLEHGW